MNLGEQTNFGYSKFFSPISTLYDSFLTLVYPQSCRICEKSVESNAEGVVCAKCWQNTHIFTDSDIFCHKCNAFLGERRADFKTFCQRCTEDFYDLARAIGIYEKALFISILQLKQQPHLPKHLEKLLFSAFEHSPFQDATCIIPVPLSKIRFAERGFNQAELLAQSLSKQSGLRIYESSLKRVIHTEKHRVGMDRKARLESVKGAFKVISPRLIEGQKILLIDDVFTSGSTVSNCAKMLKKYGANKVYVLTIARAV